MWSIPRLRAGLHCALVRTSQSQIVNTSQQQEAFGEDFIDKLPQRDAEPVGLGEYRSLSLPRHVYTGLTFLQK